MTLPRTKGMPRPTKPMRQVSPKKLAAGLRLPCSTFSAKPKTDKLPVDKLPLPRAPWRELPEPQVAAAPSAKKRPKDTGPTKATRNRVKARDKRCVRCGREVLHGVAGQDYSLQHILGRGAGGTLDPQVNDVDWLILVCGNGSTLCHGEIEGKYRAKAYADGHARKRTAIYRHKHTLLWHGRRCQLRNGRVFDALTKKEVSA